MIGTHCKSQTDLQIALRAAVGFGFDLLLAVTELHFGEARVSIGKGQGWHFNPFQLRKSGFTLIVIIGLTVSTFYIPNSQINCAIPGQTSGQKPQHCDLLKR